MGFVWIWKFLITWETYVFWATFEVEFYPDYETCTWWFPKREVVKDECLDILDDIDKEKRSY